MSKCVEYKTVSRMGKPHKVCAQYTASSEDDVLVRKDDADLGAYSLSKIGALKPITSIKAKGLAGPAVGLTGFLAGNAIARIWGHKIGSWVVDYAPVSGMILGSLISLPLAKAKGMTTADAQKGVLTAVFVGLGTLLMPRVDALLMRLGSGSSATGAYALSPVRGMGALPAALPYTDVPTGVSNKMDRGKKVFGSSYMSK